MARFGVSFDRASIGRAITGRMVNAPQKTAEGLSRGSVAGMRTTSVDQIPISTPGVGVLRFAKTGASGIDAMSGMTPGSAECGMWLFDGADLVDTGASEMVYNWTPTAVGANKIVVVATIDNANFIVADSC